MKSTIFLVTNGFEGTWPAIQYAAWLAQVIQASVTLVGVVEEHDEQHPVEDMLSQAVALFQKNAVTYERKIYKGQVEEVIRNEVKNEQMILTFGPLGRSPLRRWLIGRSFRHIMAEVPAPILYVPETRIPAKKILICFGGLGYTLTAEHLGILVARASNAALTFLHVVPPIDLDYPPAKEVHDNWQHLSDTDTLTGRMLRQALNVAQSAGVSAEIKVRHGRVVSEILEEIRSGDYDLVCMGSSYSAHGLRHLYLPNITAEVAEVANYPVLTARYRMEITVPV
jgi:nucleotide-binding universal stress UspA family protein